MNKCHDGARLILTSGVPENFVVNHNIIDLSDRS